MDGWKVRVLPFVDVVVDEGWDGKCSRNRMEYLLPTKLYVRKGYAYNWRTVIKQ